MIEGISGSVKRFLIETEIGLTRNALHLHSLNFSRPGRQGHFVGDGRITFTADDILMHLSMRFSDLDLSRELGIKTAFSGTLNIEGNPKDYRGDFRIENTKGKWYSGHLSGRFKGGLQKAHITFLEGFMLDGSFQGDLNIRWEEELSLKGSLQARNLNPAIITPDWDGKINLDLEGTFHFPKKDSPEGKLSVGLHKSHLRGQPFTGNIELHWEKSILRIARAEMKGKGFDLSAKGVLQERVTFNADISDLSGLIPGTRGSLLAKGWSRWQNQNLAMNFNGHGKDLFLRGIELGAVDLSARFDEREESPIELKGRFLNVAYKSFRIDSVTLDASGKLSNHRMIISAHRPEGQVKSTFEGNYSKEGWRGKITQLSGSDAAGDWKLQVPAEVLVSSRQIKLESLQISSTGGEDLQVNIDLTLRPLRGTVRGEWHQLNLGRANPWLRTPRLMGHKTGDLSIQWLEEDRLRLGGKVNLAGTFTDPPLKVDLSRGLVKFDWSEKGLSASWELEDRKSGKLTGNLSSPQPGRMAMPDRGRLEANWEGIDVSHLQPFLPQTLTIEGCLRGKLSGHWTDRMKQFRAAGELKVSQGMMRWKYGKERITTALQAAEVTWDWHDDRLRGSLSLALEEVGRLKGSFGFPLETHWPTSVRDKGPIRLSLEGQFEEKGLLPTFFPNLVRESHGKVDLGLHAGGTWEKPHLKGSMRLTKAEVHLLAGKPKAQDNKTVQPADKILRFALDSGLVQFDWDEKMLQAMGEFELAPAGKLRASLSSPQPARMALFQQAKLEVRWDAIDLSLLRPWLPQAVAFDGRLAGQISGQWLQGSRFDHAGEFKVSRGTLKWQNRDGQIAADLQTLDLNWIWQDETLEGRLSMVLADYCNLKGTFHLPVAPRLPIVIRKKAPVQLSLKGLVRERGLLAAFFPDFIQRSRGQVDLNLSGDGTWEKRHLQGLLRLRDTEVHLLTNEIRLQSVKKNISQAPFRIELSEGLIEFNWDEKGLSSSCDLKFTKGGKFQIGLSSSQPARMAFPDRGRVEASWQAFDLSVVRPWLPPEMALEGQLSGNLSGQYSNKQFDTIGEIGISQGVVNWKHEAGSVNAALRKADLVWNWRGNNLRCEVSLILADYGHAKGNFELPLAARFPLNIRLGGPIQLSLNGQFEEKGLLPAFFPGIVQESRGQIHLNLTGNGTWEKPNLLGTIKLEKAGGYLPVTGIRLEDMSTEAQFGGDQIRITSFSTRSGPGHLEGDATIWLENWKVSRYEGRLRGDRFQTIHLPELQVLSNPRLDFHGTTRRLVVRGEILLPDLLVSGPPTKDVVRPSPDVIIVDAPEVAKPRFPLALDIEVRLLLGEKVYYKAEGIDVRLKGDLRLNVQDPYRIAATGEINVAQGHYSFYGHKLEIIRGRLLFAGGPVDSPTLDALAVRKIGEVQAGMTVAGSLQKPVVKLYSQPAMPDTDILAYIVLGQPLGKGTEQVPSLAQAAGALLSAGESVVLQGQLKKLFGLDTLDITTPPGGGEVSRSMVTVGKYLTPKLYISLGRSLFTDATLVTLRYSLSKRLEIETTTGTESGATLFYRIEFR